MDTFSDARRELVLAAVALVALGGLVIGPLAGVVAALVGAAVALGGLGSVGALRVTRRTLRAIPVEAVAVPTVLAAGAVGAIRVVPPGLAWLPLLAAFALVLAAALRLETRLLTSSSGPSDADRSRVLAFVVLAAFVGFVGVAAVVPGGLVEAGFRTLDVEPAATTLTVRRLIALVVGDALVAFVLGYRASALRYAGIRDRLWSAVTYAVVIAVAAGAARAIDLPRLIGPALLTLVLYLWDALHGSAPTRRREARFLWETGLLVALGIVVVAWNLRVRA